MKFSSVIRIMKEIIHRARTQTGLLFLPIDFQSFNGALKLYKIQLFSFFVFVGRPSTPSLQSLMFESQPHHDGWSKGWLGIALICVGLLCPCCCSLPHLAARCPSASRPFPSPFLPPRCPRPSTCLWATSSSRTRRRTTRRRRSRREQRSRAARSRRVRDEDRRRRWAAAASRAPSRRSRDRAALPVPRDSASRDSK